MRPGLPLSGVRVLDLTRLAPGPYATLILADLGAEVVKLEPPEGDATRAMPPGGAGELFAALNRGKRSLVLDLKRPRAVEAVTRLLARCDVLVEGFRPGVMERLGLGHAALREAFPGLVVCALSGFGQTGPDRARAGHDLGTRRERDFLRWEAATERRPCRDPDRRHRRGVGGGERHPRGPLARATGRGRLVDVSLVESATSFAALHLGPALLGFPVPPAGQGMLDGGLPSYGLYRTADDRWLAVAALEPSSSQLCERLGLGTSPPRRTGAGGGGAGAGAAGADLRWSSARHVASDWRGWMPAWSRCCCRRRSAATRTSGRGGCFPARACWRRRSPGPRRPGLPRPREHTREVLSEAGLTPAEIDALV